MSEEEVDDEKSGNLRKDRAGHRLGITRIHGLMS